MSTPFLALAPFTPRVVDIPYVPFLPTCLDCTDCTEDGGDSPYDPDEGFTVKAGRIDLEIDDEEKAVVFTNPFPSPPRGVTLTVLIPEDGYTISASVEIGTITADGFTARLGAIIPAEGYVLSWIAVL